MASLDNPEYTVYLTTNGTKYNITPTISSIDFAHEEKEVAQKCTLTVSNFKATSKQTMCQLLAVRQRIFVYADDGEKKDEVFRGWTWTKIHTSDIDASELKIKCYDNLIYLQQSEDAFYFSNGTKTDSVMQTICKKWGITLNYSYSTITHEKLVLRGTLTDLITSDILDTVKKRTGNEYVILNEKDVMHVKSVGQNKNVYSFEKKKNVTKVRYEQSMEDMVTKVVIVADSKSDSDKLVTQAVVKGDTATYGTLQKLQDKDDDTTLSEAKKEANETLKEHGKPDEIIEATAADIPWIKKGDKIYLNAAHVEGKYLIVAGIEREIRNKSKTMTMTLKRPVGNAK